MCDSTVFRLKHAPSKKPRKLNSLPTSNYNPINITKQIYLRPNFTIDLRRKNLDHHCSTKSVLIHRTYKKNHFTIDGDDHVHSFFINQKQNVELN